jgi:CheY-like chemotaxis protein
MTAPRILLVDDDPDLGLVVRALGRRAGWRVDHRPDAATARDYLRAEVPELLLLDVNLPGVRGPELCRQVRADGRLAGLPVALFTLPGLSADLAAGIEAGAEYFVSKELVASPDGWRRRVQEILDDLHSRASAGTVGWTATAAPLATGDWAAALRPVLWQPALRHLGTEVLRILVRRAARTACGPRAPDPFDWLSPDGSLAPPDPLPPGFVPAALIFSLADQVRRLLGAAAAAPALAAFTAIAPALREVLSHE